MCEFTIGLLGKCLDFHDVVIDRLADLNVAVSGLGTCRFDSESKQRVIVLDKLKSFDYALLKLALTCDQVVARTEHYARLGIDRRDVVCRPGDARGGVAAGGLEQDAVIGDVGQLLFYDIGIDRVCDDKDIFFRNDRKYTVITHLEQRAAGAQEVDELFRSVRAAIWPESAADAAAHDHAISMVFIHDCLKLGCYRLM